MTNLGGGKLAKFKQSEFHSPKLILADVGPCCRVMNPTPGQPQESGVCVAASWDRAGRSRLRGSEPPWLLGGSKSPVPMARQGLGLVALAEAAAVPWVRLAPVQHQHKQGCPQSHGSPWLQAGGVFPGLQNL